MRNIDVSTPAGALSFRPDEPVRILEAEYEHIKGRMVCRRQEFVRKPARDLREGDLIAGAGKIFHMSESGHADG